MAKPTSAFRGKFRQEIDPMDPVLRECKRKVAYPLRSMAEKDAHAASVKQNEEMEVYTCQHCGKFHWGHKMKNPPKPEEQKVDPPQVVYKQVTAQTAAPKLSRKNWLPPQKKTMNLDLIDTTDLAKLRDDFRNVYVFRMPPEMPHSESNILDHGVLISMKKGDEDYKEPDGSSSPAQKWRAYHHNISTTYSRLKPLEFQKRIAPHVDGFGKPVEEPVENEKAAPALPNTVLSLAVAKKLKDTLVEKNEEFKGKKIWRDEEGKAFLVREVPCLSCKDPIRLKSRVYEPNGVFTVAVPYKPADDSRARLSARGAKTWLCGKCACPPKPKVEPRPVQKTEAPAPEISPEDQEWMNAPLGEPAAPEPAAKVETPAAVAKAEEEPDFLTALQRMTEDSTVPSERIRGMAFIAVEFLKSR